MSLKKQRSKEMSGEISEPRTGKRLVCIKECVAPDIGHWKHGDVITAPALVERFAANPNFKIQED